MAIMVVSVDAFNDDMIRGLILRSFNSVELLCRRYTDLVLKVDHDELPNGDIFIQPLLLYFEGIEPFIIDFNIKTP